MNDEAELSEKLEKDAEELKSLREKTAEPGALFDYLFVMSAELDRLTGLIQIAYTTIAETYPEEDYLSEAREKTLALLGAGHDLGQLLLDQMDVVMENEYVVSDGRMQEKMGTKSDVNRFL